MAGLDLSSFNNLIGNVGSLVPSGSALAENIALGAATSVFMGGLKSQQGQDALDPLHLFHDKPQSNPNAVAGATITAAAFAALPPATQAQLIAAGVHIL